MEGGEHGMNVKKLLVGAAASALMFGVALLFGSSIVPTFAASPLISNGSFESGTPSIGSFITLSPGATNILKWNVVSGNIDYIGTYWTSADGSRSIDMNGNVPGAISQTFATIPGHTYTVTFDMAGNPDGGRYGSPAVKTMNVDTGGTPASYSFDTTGHSDANMGWQQETYTFTATSSSTTLTFTSTTTGGPFQWFGPALDNVVATDTLTNMDQCKNGGWQAYSNPTFKNQGDCVRYIQSNPNATGNKTK